MRFTASTAGSSFVCRRITNRLFAPARFGFAAVFVPALSQTALLEQMPPMYPVKINMGTTAAVFIDPAEENLHLIGIAENLLYGRDGLFAEISFGEALCMG